MDILFLGGPVHSFSKGHHYPSRLGVRQGYSLLLELPYWLGNPEWRHGWHGNCSGLSCSLMVDGFFKERKLELLVMFPGGSREAIPCDIPYYPSVSELLWIYKLYCFRGLESDRLGCKSSFHHLLAVWLEAIDRNSCFLSCKIWEKS